MRLINVETFKLEEFFDSTVPPYAILSHTWGNDNEEVSFRNIEEGKIEKAGIRPIKFEKCCIQAKRDGLRYAWIDTCCIDKANSVELGEAINSMFQWYRKASICYTYLSDVPAEDNPRSPSSKFFSSRWFKRGWTLQELLAPRSLCFYNSEWCYLGNKREMSAVIEMITGIPRPFLLGIAELREASIAQRMSWAAKRVTKRKEDISYCLLGIFGVMMPMIYGEGDQAFSRLQQEIMREARDDSILAWGLNLTESTPSNSTNDMSGGVLATAPSDFVNCGHIVSREQVSTPVKSMDFFGGSLRVHLPLYKTSAGETYGLLSCGPGDNTKQVVAIPLGIALPKEAADEYIRPHGRHSILLNKAPFEVSTRFIHIQKERQSRAHNAVNRRYWFYIEESVETNLEIIDVEPRVRWLKDNAMIMTSTEPDGNIIQRAFARFRHKEEGSLDFVVVLEFQVQRSQTEARCHVMISSRDTALENIAQKLIYLRKEAFGKQSASNGILNLSVTLREEFVAGQPMFVVRLAAMSRLPEVTVDATLELQQLDLKLELVSTLLEESKILTKAEGLVQEKDSEITNLELLMGQLEVVEEKLGKLVDAKRLLIDGIEKASQEIDQLAIRGDEIGQRQNKLSERRLQTLRRLDDLLKNDFVAKGASDHGPEAIVKMLTTGVDIDLMTNDGGTQLLWAIKNGYEVVVTLLLATGKVDANMKDNACRTPLLCAAMDGHVAIVRQLLEVGATIESRDTRGWTPLSWAAGNGQEAVVKLLIQAGAELESKDPSFRRTPLSLAAENRREAVVKLLLEAGADLESKDATGRTPLSLAAENGHKAAVKLLLEKGAVLESKDIYNLTPLSWAAENGHEPAVKLLLEAGAKLESKGDDGCTPLLLAAKSGHEAAVKLLVEGGADLESQDNLRQTSLWWAVVNRHEAVMKLLLEKGVDLESKDTVGRTPLSLAAMNGHEAAVKLLLEAGADVKSKDITGRTPYTWASTKGHPTVALLLEKGARK